MKIKIKIILKQNQMMKLLSSNIFVRKYKKNNIITIVEIKLSSINLTFNILG